MFARDKKGRPPGHLFSLELAKAVLRGTGDWSGIPRGLRQDVADLLTEHADGRKTRRAGSPPARQVVAQNTVQPCGGLHPLELLRSVESFEEAHEVRQVVLKQYAVMHNNIEQMCHDMDTFLETELRAGIQLDPQLMRQLMNEAVARH